MILLSIGSDNLVEVDGLKNEKTDQYVNDATITMVLRDSAMEIISGEEALSFSYVQSSDGRYYGTLPNSIVLTSGSRYFLELTCTSEGSVRFDLIPCRAQYAAGN